MFMMILKKTERKEEKKKDFFLFLFSKSNIASVGYQVTSETVPTQEFRVIRLNF